MKQDQEQSLPEVGSFEFEVFSCGKKGRRTSTRFVLRCDAIGLYAGEMLLLSCVGPETSIKALTAGLRSSHKDQKRIDFSGRVGNFAGSSLTRCPEGYRIFRQRFNYGLWQVLCLAKRTGFMPEMTEDSLWQHLQGSPFTTPLLREWTGWLYRTMKADGQIVELTQHGCKAGLLLAGNDVLDRLVSKGIQEGYLAIDGQRGKPRRLEGAAIDRSIANLDQYMLAYGPLLGKQAERKLTPLHVPGSDPLPSLELLREPFTAQSHLIEAARNSLTRQKALLLVGEMGTGKTIMGMAAIHAHACGNPYRALVFCPGQLLNKWEREIRETIPDVEVIQLSSWTSLLNLSRPLMLNGLSSPGIVPSWAQDGNLLPINPSILTMVFFAVRRVACGWSAKIVNLSRWASLARTGNLAPASGNDEPSVNGS